MSPFKLSAIALALLAGQAAAQTAPQTHAPGPDQKVQAGKTQGDKAETGSSADDGKKVTDLAQVTIVDKYDRQNSYTVPDMGTATGLKLAPKDTPQSVSVITRKQMDDLGVTTLEDALKTTTGLNIYRQGYRISYQSRGFNIAQISEDGVNSTVCTMCGNNPHDQKQLTDTGLYERIEVVRGATGLRKSQSEPGGSINAVRKRPLWQPLTELTASANRFGTVRSGLDMARVLNTEAQLRGRAVLILERSDSFQKHVDGNKAILYGVVDKSFGGMSKLTLGGLYHNERDTPHLFGLPIYPDGTDMRLPRSTYLGASWNYSRYHKYNVFAEWEKQFNDDWKLVSLLDYKKSDSVTEYAYIPQRSNIGADGRVTDGFRGRSDRDTRQWSFKADLDGKYSLFGHRHELYAGYSYEREQFDNLWRGRKLEGSFPIWGWTGNEIPRPDNWDALTREVRFTKPITQTLTLATRLNFGNLHVLAGGSYSHWKQSQYLSWFKEPYSNEKKGFFTPYAGLTYDLGAHNTLYASFADIGQYNGERYDINRQLLPPVRGYSYEIGWKTAWYEGRLNTAVALFQTEKHNYPVDTWLGFDPDTGQVRPWERGDLAIYTPVRMESRGIDLEVSGNVTPEWQLFAGYTYNRRRYTKTAAARTAERNGRGVDFSQHTPKHILRMNTAYRLPGLGGKWLLLAGVNMQSRSSPITINKQKQYLGGYAVWNAGLQYELSKNMKFSLRIDNLADRRYYESYGHRGTNQGHFYGEPRNVTLNFKWTM
ncbi:MAG: TonB-dependent siderophore receptor [Ottowia sp.]